MSRNAILNYTTTIEAKRTAAEIVGMLAEANCSGVNIAYADRRPTSIVFSIDTAVGPREFRLPANVPGVEAALVAAYAAGKIPRRYANRDQAERVAWRIVRDWLESQLALIEAGLAEIAEVMMPYMLVGPTGETAWQLMQRRQVLLPGPDERERAV